MACSSLLPRRRLPRARARPPLAVRRRPPIPNLLNHPVHLFLLALTQRNCEGIIQKKIANSRIKFSNKSQWYGTLGVQNYHQRQEFDGGTPEAALPYHQRPTTEQAKLKQRVQAAQRQDQAAGGPPLAAPRGTTAPPPTGHDCAQSEPKAQPAAADSNNWGPAYVQPHWAS